MEVFNIGSGNAATALSVILNKKIDMQIPDVRIVKLEEALENDFSQEVVAVLVKVVGEISGDILYVFERETVNEIIQSLDFKVDIVSDMGISIISEIANIIAASCMNAIADFTELKMVISVPAVTYDMFNAIFTTTFADLSQYDEYILTIETLFKIENSSDKLGRFYYIPQKKSLENILKQLKMI